MFRRLRSQRTERIAAHAQGRPCKRRHVRRLRSQGPKRVTICPSQALQHIICSAHQVANARGILPDNTLFGPSWFACNNILIQDFQRAKTALCCSSFGAGVLLLCESGKSARGRAKERFHTCAVHLRSPGTHRILGVERATARFVWARQADRSRNEVGSVSSRRGVGLGSIQSTQDGSDPGPVYSWSRPVMRGSGRSVRAAQPYCVGGLRPRWGRRELPHMGQRAVPQPRSWTSVFERKVGRANLCAGAPHAACRRADPFPLSSCQRARDAAAQQEASVVGWRP